MANRGRQRCARVVTAHGFIAKKNGAANSRDAFCIAARLMLLCIAQEPRFTRQSCPFCEVFAPMAKSLSKIWLGGLKRLLAIQSEHAHKTTKRTTTRPARPASSKPSTKVRPLKSAALRARRQTRERRTLPRANRGCVRARPRGRAVRGRAPFTRRPRRRDGSSIISNMGCTCRRATHSRACRSS